MDVISKSCDSLDDIPELSLVKILSGANAFGNQ